MLNKHEQLILAAWEEVYKRGQLGLWILIALKHGPKHMAQIRQWISETTEGTITADDKSIYRALRRFRLTGVVSCSPVPNCQGPDIKVYSLSGSGQNVLGEFVARNFGQVVYRSDVKNLFLKGVHDLLCSVQNGVCPVQKIKGSHSKIKE